MFSDIIIITKKFQGGRNVKKIFVLVMAFILAGCGTNHAEQNPEPSGEENTNGGNIEENQKEQADGTEGQTSHENDEPEENGEEEQMEESNEPSRDEPMMSQYYVDGNWSVKPIDGAKEEVVLITIDDAPDKYGLEMAKTLKELDVPAIFFVNGIFIEAGNGREQLKDIYDMGFEIGNHTFSHKKLSELSKEEQYEEIVRVNDLVEEITGERPKFFRAPFGVNTDYSKQVAKDEGMVVMNWSFGYDWNQEYMNEKALADIMVNAKELGNGSNLLMHDREWTFKALDDIVAGLREKGFGFVDPDLIETSREVQEDM